MVARRLRRVRGSRPFAAKNPLDFVSNVKVQKSPKWLCSAEYTDVTLCCNFFILPMNAKDLSLHLQTNIGFFQEQGSQAFSSVVEIFLSLK